MDSLLLKVRNQSSQQYMLEAINAYRVGSFRSAIVSTWISLTFDIISKLRELAAANESDAERLISRLDVAIQIQDTKTFLNIEADILNDAKRFELISLHEFYSLEKLRTDRHLCAHPAYNPNEEIFQPSPELVRAHIVHSLLYVLTQKPIQGKKAVQSLLDDINSPNFPTNFEEIDRFIKSKYLTRAKESFISNSVKVILKEIIKQNNTNHFDVKYFSALECFMKSKRQETISTVKNSINKYINTHETFTLVHILKVIPLDPEIWNIFTSENKISITTAIKNNSEGIMFDAFLYKNLNNLEIKNATLEGLSLLSKPKQKNVFQNFVVSEFTEVVVDSFCSSTSYDETKNISNWYLFDYAHLFRVSHLKKIITCSTSNTSIRQYFSIEHILKRLFSKTNHLLEYAREDWEQLIASDPAKYSSINQLLNPTINSDEEDV
ncbi:MAG: hypothetical protein HOP07_00920 [Bacteriovoracaceae bacterium]|nr:hypothetical protein [Bacteriovoracaceae bacterium]